MITTKGKENPKHQKGNDTMIKVTMVNEQMDATVIVNNLGEAWAVMADQMLPGTTTNIHAEDTETGEVKFLFQEGKIQHMEPDALTGFLDMVYEVNPLLAMVMALDLLATMEQALGE